MSGVIMDSIHQIGDNMLGGFFVYKADETEEILYANEIVLDIFGCNLHKELQELTGNRFSGLVFPEDLKQVKKSISVQVSDFGYVRYDGRLNLCKEQERRRIHFYGRAAA